MSGHTHIHTYIRTYTQDNYSNPRCACAPRVNNCTTDTRDYNATRECLELIGRHWWYNNYPGANSLMLSLEFACLSLMLG